MQNENGADTENLPNLDAELGAYMSSELDASELPYRPELIFCICAPLGTDTTAVTDAISASIDGVGYIPVPIKLSALMMNLLDVEKPPKFEDERIRYAMHAGNSIRKHMKENDALARIALSEIHDKRASLNPDRDGTVPAEGHCFIISSLKREEEIDTLRTLFGRRVFLLSIYEPVADRIENLSKRIARSRKSPDFEGHRPRAQELLDIDQKEGANKFGQRLQDVFPVADVFLKAGPGLREDTRRFVNLLFRAPFITPTMDEFLMFHARASSQRSADLSRQVGAVIATNRGDILSTGCNEVPRAGGGVNWDNITGSKRDLRDFKIGHDSAATTKKLIVADIMEALKLDGWLQPKFSDMDAEALAEAALFEGGKPLAGRMVANLLEFGRIVHAEMAAICDAAMRGVKVEASTLYCTTFPCHICARHIIAAGVRRVVYIEPYPKSRAKKLYTRAIQVDEDREADPDAVKFEAFVGVAPRRFLEFFDMVERKDNQGYALSELPKSEGPKGIVRGTSVSVLEPSYLSLVGNVDWAIVKTEVEGATS